MGNHIKRHTIIKNSTGDKMSPVETITSSPITTYKLPPEEIERIFKNIKPEKVSTIHPCWPRRKEVAKEGMDPAWKFDSPVEFEEEEEPNEDSEDEW